MRILALVLLFGSAQSGLVAQEPRCVSGIYPHLAFFNDEGECGTGAVVTWAGRLWALTYAPHKPRGSSDKLYEITRDLALVVRPESVGGTPASRFVHRESNQLFLGPYVIDADRNVRVIPPSRMFGRLTGTARHLADPARKVVFATMEEGFYEVDVASLAVTTLWSDEQIGAGRHADLPGYHGKGLASGQGRLVYANNGDHAEAALRDPSVPSGVLAEWDGKADAWKVVRRAQFTDVTGPGGIAGNADAEHDPLWSIGWDHRSLLLMALDHGTWHSWRLPKASHCYDGAHGWNTEWPRIREIGEGPLLMTMHGMFWSFPREFAAGRSAGVAPRSTYLKVVGDFCRFSDRIVLGCDDTAKSAFLNESKAKGKLEGPGQSNSNLWFVAPERLDALGPALGRGAVWLDEPVAANAPSDAMLFAGFARRGVHLAHDCPEEVHFTFEVDRAGDGRFTKLRSVTAPPGVTTWVEFAPEERGAWVRVTSDRECRQATASFHFADADHRGTTPGAVFRGIAAVDAMELTGGVLRVRGENRRTLAFAADTATGGTTTRTGYYELDGTLALRRVDDAAAERFLRDHAPIARDVVQVDAASVLYVDGKGRRWRLPKGPAAFDHESALGPTRVAREVCTERDLFCAHGTIYELPAENAGGFARIRPVASHELRFVDFASYRGLLVLSGLAMDASGEHVVRSDDDATALWVGAVDDLWELGKPRGEGGPWTDTRVVAGETSDPYLMTGYDSKSLRVHHDAAGPVQVRLEVDVAGTGHFRTWKVLTVPPRKPLELVFPSGFAAYWLRAVSDTTCRATLRLTYR